jgi:hypothetical protein
MARRISLYGEVISSLDNSYNVLGLAFCGAMVIGSQLLSPYGLFCGGCPIQAKFGSFAAVGSV